MELLVELHTYTHKGQQSPMETSSPATFSSPGPMKLEFLIFAFLILLFQVQVPLVFPVTVLLKLQIHKVSQKADVYSFGVILFELLTGRPPTHSLLTEEGVDLPRYVQSLVREEWITEVFDMDLRRRNYKDVEEEMVQLLELAIECTRQHPDTRPSMDVVVFRIEGLCQSSLHKNLDKFDSFQDADDEASQWYYSADSMAAPSSSE